MFRQPGKIAQHWRPVLSPRWACMSPRLHDKICQGVFVNFSLLYNDAATAIIAKSNEQQATNLTVAVEGGNVVLKKPGVNRKKIETFDMRQLAFNVFMSIYITKHPSRCLELLKYAELIRTASIQFPGLGWRAYDEQFRLRQANLACSWGELILSCGSLWQQQPPLLPWREVFRMLLHPHYAQKISDWATALPTIQYQAAISPTVNWHTPARNAWGLATGH